MAKEKVENGIDQIEEGQIDKIQGALQGLRSGMAITVYRVRPTWCKGWLEKIDYVDDEPIDIEYLVKQWGGEVLRIRITDEHGKYIAGGQADVPLYSYPPKFHGRVLEPPRDEPIPYKRSAAPDDRPYQMQAPQYAQAPANPLDSAASLASLIKQLSESQQKGLTNYIDFLTRTAPAQAAPSFGGLDQVVQVARVWQQLQGIFGNSGVPAPAPVPLGTGDDQFLPYLADIIKTVLHKEPPKPKPQIRAPHIVPPRAVPLAGPQRPQAAGPKEAELAELARSISGLDPNDAAEVVAGAFGMMPEDRRNVAIPRFMEIVSGDDDQGDDDDEEDDDDQGEDDDRDQVDATPKKE